MSSSRTSAGGSGVSLFGVGDRVRVKLAGQVLPAVVVEDRGNLGPHGARVFRIAVSAEAGHEEGSQFEVLADALELISKGPSFRRIK